MDEFLGSRLWPSSAANFSAFQYLVSNGSKTISGFAGKDKAEDTGSQINENTLFDLASLTKLYTATLAAILHDSGKVDLDEKISSLSEVPEPLASLTSRELLTHTSGLAPEWEEKENRGKTIESLFSSEINHSQRGTSVYSCTGYSLFSVLLERKFDASFEEILQEKLLGPLALTNTVFNPGEKFRDSVMAEKIEHLGVVHDPRARAMDGISGNAGLFANASDVGKFLEELINTDSEVISEGVRAELFTPTVTSEWSQAVGFRLGDKTRVGNHPGLFSHTGFTGTLALVNPKSNRVGVLLTNRLSCGTSKQEMAEIYKAFADHLESIDFENN